MAIPLSPGANSASPGSLVRLDRITVYKSATKPLHPTGYFLAVPMRNFAILCPLLAMDAGSLNQDLHTR